VFERLQSLAVLLGLLSFSYRVTTRSAGGVMTL
jgi:hypothetical protein